MATILLSAAGAAVGSGFGGTVLGLSGAVVGRAVGATVGRSIDQAVLGAGSDVTSIGKVERFHVSGAGYGSPIKEVWGRMRVAGEIIWASRFMEHRRTSGGGKGSRQPAQESFSYSVSIAIAVCLGETMAVGRVWADGVEVALNSLNLRFYPGSETQLPDPKIEAVEGVGFAPSYRGVCYVVIENLALSRFGNRVPQFSFEVIRSAQGPAIDSFLNLSQSINAVALIPGSGEYALAMTPVHFSFGPGQNVSANVSTVQDMSDMALSLTHLADELPNCGAVSLVVSWFGDDLRCNHCQIQPKVERHAPDGVQMPWNVSSTNRGEAQLIPQVAGRAIYGGTPADRSVVEAIQAIRNSGKEVMFYPFILMDQLSESGLPDPWLNGAEQPALPWRGRITLEHAPGQPGTTDQTSSAENELASFLGNALPEDFSISQGTVGYSGPVEWSYRRFILHYAHLCAMAGGVDTFCIGSELRSLTQIRSSEAEFPMVKALKVLAAEVKAILGNQTKVSYAADWSEYFGYHTGGDVFFHLDDLWSDDNIDFVGVDNYMPLSDWRDDAQHADSDYGSIYNPDYLQSNIAGGEGFDWYYDSEEGAISQQRIPIADIEFGEDWIFRYKDLKGWWSNDHHNRIAGQRLASPTGWVPGMKPIVFTEYGCAAIDKGSNQPNRFIDAKSSESGLPRGSTGQRDDFIQMQYFGAMHQYWTKIVNNPVSNLYSGSMVDFRRSFAWAWDARPFPEFPGNVDKWSDGANYSMGHWLNGRATNQQIASIVAEVCASFGVVDNLELSKVYGHVRGYVVSSDESARVKLEKLQLAFGLDLRERDGLIELTLRDDSCTQRIGDSDLVDVAGAYSHLTYTHEAGGAEIGRVTLTFVEAENDFHVRTIEAFASGSTTSLSNVELNFMFTEGEAGSIAERMLTEANIGRKSIQLSLPKSRIDFSTSDLVLLGDRFFRIDRIEEADYLKLEARCVEPSAYKRGTERTAQPTRATVVAATPVFATFLDLPLLNGEEVPYSPHVAVTASPWPGTVGVWSSASDAGYSLNKEVLVSAVLGVTENDLAFSSTALWDRGSRLRIKLASGSLSSASTSDVLNGANVLAIGDGSPENWEILQFSEATVVGLSTYELTSFLRGLSGTDATMPLVWPEGSLVIALDNLLPQIDSSMAARGLTRYYRIGSLEKDFTDPNVVSIAAAFQGIGLRPYSVCHLKGEISPVGDIDLTWVRRTRTDGDNWQSVDVPLGEATLSFTVRVMQEAVLLRETEVTEASWRYTQAMQHVDGVSGPLEFAVAQNSESFGPGPYRSVLVA